MVKISIKCSKCGLVLPKTEALPDVSPDDPGAGWSMTVFVKPCPSCSAPAQPEPVYPRYVEADPQPVQIGGQWIIVINGDQLWKHSFERQRWELCRSRWANVPVNDEMRPDFLHLQNDEQCELVQRRDFSQDPTWKWKITKREVS
jgi:hypothetical protein